MNFGATAQQTPETCKVDDGRKKSQLTEWN